jgi:DNA-binding CsgD family transcriptional regulator
MKYFQCESEKLPEELNSYINYHRSVFDGNEFYLPPVPLKKVCQDAKLIIRLTFHSFTKTTVLLFEEIPNPSSANFEGLQLTNRETEILFWISQGKTDGEIGLILNISIRTVQKHVENIFNKLGVENRTAAVSRVTSNQ